MGYRDERNKVLSTNGVAIFIEPLIDNPLGKLIRFLTPGSRTKNERPLSRMQIEHANKLFSSFEHKFFNLTSVPIGIASSFFLRKPDNIALRFANLLDTEFSKTVLKY